MTSPAEGAPQQPELIDSPASLSGLSILNPGASVEIVSLGMAELQNTPGGEDVLTIVTGRYEGRKPNGGAFGYNYDAQTAATRILDIGALPITVTADGQLPVKPRYASLHWETPAPDAQPEPIFQPLLPGTTHSVRTETGAVVATYGVGNAGELTVARTTEAATEADVRLVGAAARPADYARHPAVASVSVAEAVMHRQVSLDTSPATKVKDGYHLEIEAGQWALPVAEGETPATAIVGRTLMVPYGADRAYETITAQILASRQQAQSEGPATVGKYTTIGKDEPPRAPGQPHRRRWARGNGPGSA
ncbi:MAG TPA: hypothetical protein VLF62_01215 [Candidatus Saccharimonadales bacterium]|nr:hypothetical protein [Candidatus Saccharimonadales bacterium]